MAFRSAYKWSTVAVLVVVLAGAYFWYSRMGQPAVSPTLSASATPLSDDKVRLDSPLPGAYVSSPLVVNGQARGTWYFEASFPVVLTDANGTVLAQVPAQAQSDWMTTGWVPFEATLTFSKQPSGSRGFLILKKDNPSGLPQYEDSRQITVYFP